jgi:hypothetical protein
VPRTLTMGGRGMPVGGGVSIDTFCAYIRIFLGPKNNISAEGGPRGASDLDDGRAGNACGRWGID